MSRINFLTLFLGLTINLLGHNVDCRIAKRMIGGLPDDHHKLKYVVRISIDEEDVCTGALVSEQHVLTAANCIFDKTTNELINSTVMVYAGASDWNSPDAIEMRIKRLYMPKSDNPSILSRNIVLLELPSKLDIKSIPNLSIVELPLSTDSGNEVNADMYKDAVGTVAGYGIFDRYAYFVITINDTKKDFIQTGSSAKVLQHGSVDVLSHNDCNVIYNQKLQDSVLCARMRENFEGPRGMCVGDSGAPLVVDNTLIGVMSESNSICEESLVPGLYTNIAYYKDFLNKVLITGRYYDSKIRVVEFGLVDADVDLD